MAFNFPPDHESPSKKKRAEQKRKIDARKKHETDLEADSKERQQRVRDKYSSLGSTGKKVEETSRTKKKAASTKSGVDCHTCISTKSIHRLPLDGSTLYGIGVAPFNKNISYKCVPGLVWGCNWEKA
ncbi:MAG: hypothetical protein HOB79_15045 [Rhodospirillaceae bacterium]|jgi:hypothetical protein|nr:hypothetical protein [Rhodospirillales bacterium]MBT3907346.1 hypothetical protein [Rhodospirillaceae bacterium]MBT4702384.1 hypothetical protein [Rhodospirillaceae bacterium]MBT5035013.1 hypothetical protein [Rhodospirillaceae bacterium]MBT6221790.1 hypothetical protein [Rhodospirillaceae bacterium]